MILEDQIKEKLEYNIRNIAREQEGCKRKMEKGREKKSNRTIMNDPFCGEEISEGVNGRW